MDLGILLPPDHFNEERFLNVFMLEVSCNLNRWTSASGTTIFIMAARDSLHCPLLRPRRSMCSFVLPQTVWNSLIWYRRCVWRQNFAAKNRSRNIAKKRLQLKMENILNKTFTFTCSPSQVDYVALNEIALTDTAEVLIQIFSQIIYEMILRSKWN